MCIRDRLNTLQGSIIAIGNKDATELPAIKGRGIWSFGAERETLQTPELSKFTINEVCQFLQAKFKKGKKSLHTKMISIEGSSRKVPKTRKKTSKNDEVQL